MRIVAALGGNALLERGEPPESEIQEKHILKAVSALAPLARALLFGVAPLDPGVLAGVAALILTVALVANYIPARRATRIDPMDALRHE